MNIFQPVKLSGAKMIRSLAKGGLGCSWGGAVAPYTQHDIIDWPLSIEDLEPHYRAVLSFMPVSCVCDGLSDLVPFYGTDCTDHKPSAQAAVLLDRLQRNRNALESQGIFFGRSRLAVRAGETENGPACQYCGLCLYGCPQNNIYTPTATLKRLLARKNFHYRGGLLVENLAEESSKVRVSARTLRGAEKLEFEASKVILAAGLLSTTRLLLRSLKAYNRYVVMRHSEHFQVPLIRYEKIRHLESEELHTLSQIFVEIMDDSICKNTVHLQVYSYNDLYQKVFRKMAGPLWPLARPFFREIIARLMIIKGYLHSDHSSNILARLEPGEDGRLLLDGQPNPEARVILRKILKKLGKNHSKLGGVPVSIAARLGTPGMANHSGGSFPMRVCPSPFESDLMGRPYGFERVHIVDASVLPSVAATTITFTLMANAHRIASALCPKQC
jgi:choline dehydrogenase-like flavoprotein